MRATNQFLNEVKYDQSVFFLALGSPEIKIKQMEWEYLFTTV